jgi:hypothetical protein
MKTKHSILLGALMLSQAFFQEAARAADYSYSGSVDLSQSPMSVSGSTLQLDDFSLSGSMPSFNLVPGDSISGIITFANNQALTLTGNPSASDFVDFIFDTGFEPNGLTFSSTVTLLGVTGSLTSTNPSSFPDGLSNGGIGAESGAITTASSVSFTGFSYEVTLTGTQAVSDVAPLYLQVGQNGSGANFISVGSAPEPSTWTLMLCGYASLACLSRRRPFTAD